jgi:hypothetical protein
MTISARLTFWLPRIICILAIVFISIFALDAFDPNLTIWQQIQAFAMHLIPSFTLLLVLLIAWKWELVGGIIFLLIGIGLSPLVFMHNFRMNGSISMSLWIITTITFPFILIGMMFIYGHRRKGKQTPVKK